MYLNNAFILSLSFSAFALDVKRRESRMNSPARALVHDPSALRSLCGHGETYSIVSLGGLPLLALAAEVRPRHRFKARLRDRLRADRTDAIRARPDPGERLFDRSQKTTVAFMQANLKLRF